jgi:D-alanyl-D-alanine dipeptidase
VRRVIDPSAQGNPAIGVAGYPDATVTPQQAGLTAAEIPPRPPLPDATAVDDLPLVPPDPPDQDEPLVPLTHLPRVVDLATYHRAGWPGANPVGRARTGAVSRLVAAAHLLPDGFGFAVFDAWRPLPLQRRIFDHFYGRDSRLARGFVSAPSPSPATPPPHLTGGTFDLTLTWQGQPLALGTAFDEFTPRAHTRALEQEDSVERDLRRLMIAALLRVGFVTYAAEWWHVEYGTRRWAGQWLTVPRYGVAAPGPEE